MFVSLISVGLLPSAWLGFYLHCRQLAGRGHIAADRRFSFLLASAAWGATVAMITEALSAASQVNRAGLIAVWLCANGIIWGALVWGRKPSKFPELVRSESQRLLWLVRQPATWPLDIRLMLLATLLLLLATGAIGLLTPTMNWDSLTYHLPRVMHWVQQGSVRHYPTDAIAQLQMGPWAAFVQTHLFLLWGSDRLANMVQWIAMSGCAILAPWIAAKLATEPEPAPIRLQIFAALLVVTLPIGLVESITPQTDYVTAFWFVSLIGVGLDWTRSPSSLTHLIATGCVVGLGLLTKITTVFWAFPFCAVAGLWFIGKWRAPGKVAGRLLLFTLVCLVFVLPHFLRNSGIYGSPAGAKSTQNDSLNSPLSASGALSNLIRNAALHGNTGIPLLTHGLSRVLAFLHKLTGRSLQDPRTTAFPDSFQFPDKFKINDSEAGNPYHFALMLGAIGLIAVRAGQHPRLTICAVLLIVGMAGFCFLLRWQPWHSRYQLPFFVGFMPVAAAILACRWPRWALAAAAVVVTGFAVVVLGRNETRPIFNPSYLAQSCTGKMLFNYGPIYQENLATLAGDILKSGCTEVGLKFHGVDAEYPLWVLLRERGFIGRIESVFVENESASLAPEGTNPCVLVTMTGRALPAESGQRFPHFVEYGEVTARWSEKASHWCEMTWFDSESQESKAISTNLHVIPFRHRLIPLYFRSPRPGNLSLIAKAVFGQETPITNNLLRVSAVGRAVENIPVRDGQIAATLHLPAGQIRLSMGLVEPVGEASADARLDNFQWSFEPFAE